MKKALLILLTMGAFAGCMGKKEDISSEIIGNTYVLTEVEPNSEVNIKFDENRLGGSAGVNNYFAEYKIDGNTIVISNPGSTKMMGPENLMKQEDEYLKNLVDSKEIELENNNLIIITNTGEKLNFEKLK